MSVHSSLIDRQEIFNVTWPNKVEPVIVGQGHLFLQNIYLIIPLSLLNYPYLINNFPLTQDPLWTWLTAATFSKGSCRLYKEKFKTAERNRPSFALLAVMTWMTATTLQLIFSITTVLNPFMPAVLQLFVRRKRCFLSRILQRLRNIISFYCCLDSQLGSTVSHEEALYKMSTFTITPILIFTLKN